jgi:pimeloyl-ACP methyl ester carboxylesterase
LTLLLGSILVWNTVVRSHPETRDTGRVGILYLHGAGAGPETPPDKTFYVALRRAGYLVEAPEMCWSGRRNYDRAYPDCLAEVDSAIARLKGAGATGIVLAGHSFGGNTAIAYGSRHPGLLGILVLNPAFDPRALAHRSKVTASVAKAQAMINVGKADDPDFFPFTTAMDLVRATPKIYLSFNGPAAMTYMPANTPKLTAPLLWIAGDDDSGQTGPRYAFDKAPANPLSHFIWVPGNHVSVLRSGIAPALTWLRDITRSSQLIDDRKMQ